MSENVTITAEWLEYFLCTKKSRFEVAFINAKNAYESSSKLGGGLY